MALWTRQQEPLRSPVSVCDPSFPDAERMHLVCQHFLAPGCRAPAQAGPLSLEMFPGGLGNCGPEADQLSPFPPTTQLHSCAVLPTCILWFMGNF